MWPSRLCVAEGHLLRVRESVRVEPRVRDGVRLRVRVEPRVSVRARARGEG